MWYEKTQKHHRACWSAWTCWNASLNPGLYHISFTVKLWDCVLVVTASLSMARLQGGILEVPEVTFLPAMTVFWTEHSYAKSPKAFQKQQLQKQFARRENHFELHTSRVPFHAYLQNICVGWLSCLLCINHLHIIYQQDDLQVLFCLLV